MPQLTPSQAAEIALGTYVLKSRTVSSVTTASSGLRAQGDNLLGIKDMFSANDQDQLHGTSGVPMFKQLTGFGYIAQGVGAYKNEALVALRGTDIVPDWLTDATIGVSSGPTGTPVHMGFNSTYQSFATEIQAYFKSHRPTTIHCVGHSLGGALATLAADYLSANTGATVELYTFGSPRTGGPAFARGVSERLTSTRIHRVYHPADPVPMVPLWPFAHVPKGEGGLAIATSETTRIAPSAHSMRDSYVQGMVGKSWGQLKSNGAQTLTDRQIRAWLTRASKGGVLSWNARVYEMIGIALDWILRQCGTAMVIALQAAIGGTITMLDQLAYLLTRAVEISREISGYVQSLIAIILKFIGRTAAKGVSLTEQFIRWVLDVMMSTMRSMVSGALSVLR
ncbi:MAG: lipase family protein [Casimicrobium sp.]